MSTFDDLWDGFAAPLLTERFADTALCTQAGSSETTVTAFIGPEDVIEEKTDRGLNRRHVRRIEVPRTSAAANGGPCLASPSIRDIWTVGGIDYSVEAIEGQTESETVLRLVRVGANQETRQQLRRRN